MAAAVESQIGLPSPGTEESCVLVFFLPVNVGDLSNTYWSRLLDKLFPIWIFSPSMLHVVIILE